MSKILSSDDTVNLIKTGCNKVYTDTMNEITSCREDIFDISQDVEDLYKIPMDYETYFALERTGKLYQVKVPKFANNTTTVCTKTLDNQGLQCIPSTDTATNRNDYLNIPLFKWYNCNYTRNSYGEPIITYKEGETGYATTGAVDVGCFGMSFYWSWLDGNNYSNLDNNYYYLTISDKPNEDWHLQPWAGCVKHDGTVAPYWCYSKYFAGQGSDGELRSQPNLLPVCWMSHDRMLNSGALNENGLRAHSGGFQHKGPGYWGAGIDRHLFGYIFTMIKYATKSNQTVLRGCTDYYLKYSAAYPDSTTGNWIYLKTNEASNLEIGSTAIVGYPYIGNSTTKARGDDRGDSRMRAYARDVIIDSKENVVVGSTTYTKVYLKNIDGSLPSFNTAEVMINSSNQITTDASQAYEFSSADTNVSNPANFKLNTIKICTTPWKSGTTNGISGFNDGSKSSNSNGHFPFRVQGLEYSIGAWTVIGDTVMNINSNYTTDFYQAQKGVTHTNNTTNIINNYKKVGTMLAEVFGNNNSNFIGDVGLYNFNESSKSSCVNFYPIARGNGAGTGCGDYCYRTDGTGWREVLLGGSLSYDGFAGFAYLHCSHGLSSSYWYIAAAD